MDFSALLEMTVGGWVIRSGVCLNSVVPFYMILFNYFSEVILSKRFSGTPSGLKRREESITGGLPGCVAILGVKLVLGPYRL